MKKNQQLDLHLELNLILKAKRLFFKKSFLEPLLPSFLVELTLFVVMP